MSLLGTFPASSGLAVGGRLSWEMDRRQEDTKEAVLGTHRMVDKAEVGESQLTLPRVGLNTFTP